jgi:hypothetical protein
MRQLLQNLVGNALKYHKAGLAIYKKIFQGMAAAYL